MNKYFLLLLSLMFMSFTTVKAQEKGGFWDKIKGRPLIKQGDKAYQNRNYVEAKQDFQSAEVKMGTPISLLMRQANLAYRTESLEEAKGYYKNALEVGNLSKEQEFWLNFNQGNVFMKEEQWNDAIESYKTALKLKPNDSKAKYNLSYALLKRTQEDQSPEQDQEDEQDQENQENQEDQQDSKDSNDSDQNQKEPEQTPEKPNNSQLSQEQAERILQALREKEKALLEEVEEEGVGRRVLDKDW